MQEKSLKFLEKTLLKKIYRSNSSWGSTGAAISSLYFDVFFFYTSSLSYTFKNTLKLAVWGKLSILTSTTLPWKSSLTLFKGNAWKEVKPDIAAQQTPGNPSIYEWSLFHRDTATPPVSRHRAQPQQMLLSMLQCSGTEEKLFLVSSPGNSAVSRSCFQKLAQLPPKRTALATHIWKTRPFPQRESHILNPESSHAQLSFPGS